MGGGNSPITEISPSGTSVRLISKKTLEINRIIRSLAIDGDMLYARTTDNPYNNAFRSVGFHTMDTTDMSLQVVDRLTHSIDTRSFETQEIELSVVDAELIKKSITIIDGYHYYITARPQNNNITDIRIHKDRLSDSRQIAVSNALQWNFSHLNFDKPVDALKLIRVSVFNDKIAVAYDKKNSTDINVHVFNFSLQKIATGSNSTFSGMRALYSDSAITVFRAYGRIDGSDKGVTVCFPSNRLGNGETSGVPYAYFDCPRDFVGVNEEKSLAVYHDDADGYSRVIGIARNFVLINNNAIPSHDPFQLFKKPSGTNSDRFDFATGDSYLLENEFIGRTNDHRDRNVRGYQTQNQRNRYMHAPEHGENKLYSIGDKVVGVASVMDMTYIHGNQSKWRIHRRPMFILIDGSLVNVIDEEVLGVVEKEENQYLSAICGPHIIDPEGHLYFYNAVNRTLYHFKVTANKNQ